MYALDAGSQIHGKARDRGVGGLHVMHGTHMEALILAIIIMMMMMLIYPVLGRSIGGFFGRVIVREYRVFCE